MALTLLSSFIFQTELGQLIYCRVFFRRVWLSLEVYTLVSEVHSIISSHGR
jgi:hypothetical protein